MTGKHNRTNSVWLTRWFLLLCCCAAPLWYLVLDLFLTLKRFLLYCRLNVVRATHSWMNSIDSQACRYSRNYIGLPGCNPPRNRSCQDMRESDDDGEIWECTCKSMVECGELDIIVAHYIFPFSSLSYFYSLISTKMSIVHMPKYISYCSLTLCHETDIMHIKIEIRQL